MSSSVKRSEIRKKRQAAYIVSSHSPIMIMFEALGKHLLEQQDRNERLLRLGRDITIESKRIIFLLHSAVTIEKSPKQIVTEAKQRFKKLINGSIKAVAVELENVPAHIHSKALTNGFQEYVEARTFCNYIEHSYVMSLEQVQNELVFKEVTENGKEKILTVLVSPLDYMLGLADLTGEIMRKAIMDMTSFDYDKCFFARDVLRKLYCGFSGLVSADYMINAKLSTISANMQKVELAFYNCMLREFEVIPHLSLKTSSTLVVCDQHWACEDQES